MFSHATRRQTLALSDDTIGHLQRNKRPKEADLAQHVDTLRDMVAELETTSESKRRSDRKATRAKLKQIRDGVVRIELSACGKPLQPKHPKPPAAAKRMCLQDDVLSISQMVTDLGTTHKLKPLSQKDVVRLGRDMGVLKSGKPEKSDDHKGAFKKKSFELVKRLGQGCSGHVDLVRHKPTNDLYALKIQNTESSVSRALATMEVSAIERLGDSPLFVRAYAHFKEKNELSSVLEYIDGGSLVDRIEDHAFSEHEAAYYLASLLLAVNRMHLLGLLHLDLKLENLLSRADGRLVVADFGFALDCGNGIHPRYEVVERGSPHFAAPEIYSRNPVSSATDIWSIGICFYAMLAQRLPFDHDNPRKLPKVIMQAPVPNLPNGTSSDAEDLLARMLEKDPAARISFREAMEHPFFAPLGGPDYFAQILQGDIQPPAI